MNKQMIITGGAGFIGSNAAVYFANRGWDILVFDNLSRLGTESNLEMLRKEIKLSFLCGDVRNRGEVDKAFTNTDKIDAVLHLAAQVAVTTSVVDPQTDFDINALGTFNVLESLREHAPDAALIFASTNKVYGGLEHHPVVLKNGRYAFADLMHGISEKEPLDFHSPYGCSKGAADQYVRDYSRIYDMRTFVLRQSCIYGRRQFGVEDQGWVAWFVIASLLGLPITIYGDGSQTRDLLWVDDLLALYERCLQSGEGGAIYNAGGGSENQMSVQQAVETISRLAERKIEIRTADWRPGDQRVFNSDNSRAWSDLGWKPDVGVHAGLSELWRWASNNESVIRAVHSRARRGD